jgi:Tfp pilus assembly protein PilN
MINLLPAARKADIRAARINVILMRYIVIMIVAIIILAGLIIAAFIVLDTTRDSAETKVAQNQERVTNYGTVKAEADAFRSDLATAKSILDGNANFTKLIYRIASIVPPNVILDSLALDPKTFGTQTSLNAEAKTYNDATKLKNAMLQNSDIFSNVQLQTVTTEESGSSGNSYPVKITLSVTINKSALR